MHILRVIPSLNPSNGGPIEGLKQMSLSLEKLGHTTEIACLDSSCAPWLDHVPFATYPLGPGKSKYLFSRKLIPWVQLNASNYDCIIIDGLWQYSSFGAWLGLRRSGTPYFVYPHGMLDPWFKHTYPLKHLKKWLYWPWSEYRVLKNARAVLFTTQEEKELARQSFCLYHCNEEVVGFGTSTPSGNMPQQRELFLQLFPALRDKRLILFLGRIHPKKGCDLLINAFAQVADFDPSLHLVIAGPDQIGWKEMLQKQAKQFEISHRVTWTGMLDSSLKWGALQTSELFVLPSHQENFGVAVVESLAVGLPVLITNKVNLWREILADHSGFVANDELDSLVQSLRQWLNLSITEKERIKLNARQSFANRFEMDQIARHLVQTLNRYGNKS